MVLYSLDEISTIGSVATTADIIIGVAFTLMEVRHFTKTRKTEIIMKICNRFGEKEIAEAMNKVGSAVFENM
jgi:hypothetical protein